jgi:hypothetical protein
MNFLSIPHIPAAKEICIFPKSIIEQKIAKKQEEQEKRLLLYAVVPPESIPVVPDISLQSIRVHSSELDVLRLKMARKALAQVQQENKI